MPDPEKIRETVDDIREHLYAWSQWHYATGDPDGGISLTFDEISPGCGTTLCAAGFRCLRDGLRLRYNTAEDEWEFVNSDGNEHDPHVWATRSMCLTWEEADVLFVESEGITNPDVFAELAEAVIASDLDRARELCDHRAFITY